MGFEEGIWFEQRMNLVRFAHNWNVGILERWNIGFLEIGILVYWKNSS